MVPHGCHGKPGGCGDMMRMMWTLVWCSTTRRPSPCIVQLLWCVQHVTQNNCNKSLGLRCPLCACWSYVCFIAINKVNSLYSVINVLSSFRILQLFFHFGYVPLDSVSNPHPVFDIILEKHTLDLLPMQPTTC